MHAVEVVPYFAALFDANSLECAKRNSNDVRWIQVFFKILNFGYRFFLMVSL